MLNPSISAPMTDAPLRAAVVGAGFFGKLHARKLAATPGVKLVAIADRSTAHARAAAAEFGCQAMADAYALIGEADIVTVATPAIAHAGTAAMLIEAGFHAYVEKPVAVTLADADRLVAIAEGHERVVQVGHQERFVFAAMGLLGRDVAPTRVVCHRAGPWTGRGTDVNVALDLMTHDVDLLHRIATAEIAGIEAETRSRPGSYGDEVSARIAFADGCEAELFASRIADARRRFMRVTYPDGEIEIDFIARTVRNTTPAVLTPLFDPPPGQPDIGADPLGYAVADFVRCVREGTTPLVTARDGRQTLATTLAILEAAGSPATRDEALAA